MATFRTVLVAGDFSERSRRAFDIACALADETKTRMVVLHVVEASPIIEQPVAFESGMPVPLPMGGSAHHDALMERLREVYIPARPVEITYLLRDGLPSDEILRVAGEMHADLIVLATHGRTGLKRLLAGSVAEAVLRRATCPVLALHAPAGAGTEQKLRVVLHPTDFSESAQAALEVARVVARDLGARLLLMHVDPVAYVGDVPYPVVIDANASYEALEQTRAEVDGRDLKHPIHVQCEQGDPATEILRVAREADASLIVLGSHGRGALGRLLVGSVSESVLRRASCPVLIVKPRPNAPAEPVAVVSGLAAGPR